MSEGRKNSRRTIVVVALIAVALALILYMAGIFGGRARQVSAWKLRCVTSQKPTPFGDRVLYYDGSTLFCLTATGNEVWSYALGSGAGFDCDDKHVVAWVGENLHILDRNGRASYNDRLSDTVQFARVGEKYVGAVIGSNVSPIMTFKDFSGLNVDFEQTTYTGRIILDFGFFENGTACWVNSMDLYGVVPSTTMHTYRVGVTTVGAVELGENITYKVLYSNSLLNVVNTREVKLYTIRGEQPDVDMLKTDTSRLVYGWKLIDSVLGEGDARMLFAPVFQTDLDNQISELRILQYDLNRRYTLPDVCVGACLKGSTIYAFSADSLYRAEMNAQRFTAIRLPAPIGTAVTGLIGKLSNGVALVASGQDVYTVTLP